jgi:hypothetical protein
VDWVTARVSRVSGERRLLACKSRQLADTGKWYHVAIACEKMLLAITGWQPVLPQRERCVRARLARDRTELFRQRFAFFALANYESVIFAMSGPRTARDLTEL